MRLVVLSLFDGMSCGQIALKQLGITPEKYYASEIDKYAIKQTQLNFPDTLQIGDVEKWRQWDIDFSKIDLILAGSPCQGFSFAGKQLAFDDPRSKLFFVFIDILNHVRKCSPYVKFLLENVPMKKAHERIISEYCGLFPVKINSALVSAQNRERLYWSNIRTRQIGLFGEIHTDIPQPKDRGIFLRDILEKEVDEKYYVSQKVLERVFRKTYSSPAFNPEKTGTLNTKNNSGQMALDSGTTFISIDGKAPTQRAGHGGSLAKRHNYQFIKLDINGNVSKNQDKSSCFTAGAHSGGNHSDMDLICVAMRGRNPDNPSYRRTGSPTQQTLECNISGKTNGLTSVQKDNLILQRPRGNNSGGLFEDKVPTLSSCALEQNNLLSVSDRVRRLTPIECSRLQTIPGWYKWDCSDTQIYKMLGNGWTIEPIVHILKYLIK